MRLNSFSDTTTKLGSDDVNIVHFNFRGTENTGTGGGHTGHTAVFSREMARVLQDDTILLKRLSAIYNESGINPVPVNVNVVNSTSSKYEKHSKHEKHPEREKGGDCLYHYHYDANSSTHHPDPAEAEVYLSESEVSEDFTKTSNSNSNSNGMATNGVGSEKKEWHNPTYEHAMKISSPLEIQKQNFAVDNAHRNVINRDRDGDRMNVLSKARPLSSPFTMSEFHDSEAISQHSLEDCVFGSPMAYALASPIPARKTAKSTKAKKGGGNPKGKGSHLSNLAGLTLSDSLN